MHTPLPTLSVTFEEKEGVEKKKRTRQAIRPSSLRDEEYVQVPVYSIMVITVAQNGNYDFYRRDGGWLIRQKNSNDEGQRFRFRLLLCFPSKPREGERQRMRFVTTRYFKGKLTTFVGEKEKKMTNQISRAFALFRHRPHTQFQDKISFERILQTHR